VRCLVTGASGFVGRQLCRQLADQGDSVVALSRSGALLPDGTPTQALDLALHEPDEALFAGVGVVFHLAGIAHQQARESAYQQLNYLATLNLARSAAAAGVKCFVFLSSVKAMGPPGSSRMRSENDCAPPADPYGLSKWQAECALREEFSGAAMTVVILRPALVYGANAKGNLTRLAAGVRRALPRPPAEGARSMLALQDLVDLLCQVAVDPPAGIHTWIVCDGRSYSTRTLYDALRHASGKGRGVAWLPHWGWRLGAAMLDMFSRGGESTYNKLFGTELYSNSTLLAEMAWRPRGRLEDVIKDMVTGERDSGT
jgi:nucleoside-diphosphate-sugar epimerase